jgi:alkylation response protein AidB-like acyl-CoA dehydrogenase
MDLELDEHTVAFRDEARAWLTANVPRTPLASFDTAKGFDQHRAWEAQLADARWSVVSWPTEFGGRDASLLEWVIFEEEYYASGAPARVSQNGIFMLAPTLFTHGTPEQRARILPSMARGEEIWAQAWSEPEAGSDLASLRSTAVKAPGGWLLSGQKTWSSRAAFADRAFGLFRTDPESKRHKGLTYFMFDLSAPSVQVRPIRQLDGEPGFAEIFLDEVFVPDAEVIGEPGTGVAGGDDDSQQRARPLSSQPGSIPRHCRSTARVVARARQARVGGQPSRRCLDRRAGLPAVHLRHCHQTGRGR